MTAALARICRHCGEGRPDGWACADLCSACPADATRVHPVSPLHLAQARFQEVDRAVTATGQTVTHRMVEFPQVVSKVRSERGRILQVNVYVGVVEVEAGNLDQMARLINAAEGRNEL